MQAKKTQGKIPNPRPQIPKEPQIQKSQLRNFNEATAYSHVSSYGSTFEFVDAAVGGDGCRRRKRKGRSQIPDPKSQKNLKFRNPSSETSMKLLRILTCVLLGAPLNELSQATAGESVSKPDILLIMPDQWRGDALGIRGHPVVRTPHIDSLAWEGALFRRAYSTCPSCIPARYALLTGLHPSTSGIVGYKATPIHHPTFPKLLADAGYVTALIGRYMHQVPEKESYGYQTEIRGSIYVSGDDYDTFLKKAAPDTGGIRALMEKLGVTANGWEARPWPLAEELHPIAWAVRETRRFLKESSAEKPLFLTASFFSPHPPLFPLPRYFEYYEKQKLPSPAHGDWVDWSSLSTKGDGNGHRVLLEGATLRATLSGYFGLMAQLDDAVGPLITEFKER